jgi:hypothetical protein
MLLDPTVNPPHLKVLFLSSMHAGLDSVLKQDPRTTFLILDTIFQMPADSPALH